MCKRKTFVLVVRQSLCSVPVLEREAGQLRVVVDPFELQRPASLSHAGQHQPVAFQMELAAHRLCLEVGRYIIWEE